MTWWVFLSSNIVSHLHLAPYEFVSFSLMYSPMQSLSSFALGLGVVFSSVFITTASFQPISNGPKTRSLATRQAPGVVATSDFLRRAGHACTLTTFLTSSVSTDLLYSRCCWGLGLYRWRRVLIHERWDTTISILYALF